MNYLRSIILRDQPQRDLYLNEIPAVQQLLRDGTMDFLKPVTIFVGENGTGKSTILEAIAIAMGFNAEGGGREHRFSTIHSTDYKQTEHYMITKQFFNDPERMLKYLLEADE